MFLKLKVLQYMHRADAKSMTCSRIWKFYWKGTLETYKLHVYSKTSSNVIFSSQPIC